MPGYVQIISSLIFTGSALWGWNYAMRLVHMQEGIIDTQGQDADVHETDTDPGFGKFSLKRIYKLLIYPTMLGIGSNIPIKSG